MSLLGLEQTLENAIAHHRAGRFVEAERIYRQILAHNPNEPDALHLLGLIAHQVGQSREGIKLIERAIAIKPTASNFHCSLAEALEVCGDLDRAEASYRTALQLRYHYPEACNLLGKLLLRRGRYDDAAVMFHNALALKPDWADALHNLSMAMQARHDLDGAASALQRALDIEPDPAGWNNLGNIRKLQGQLDEAIACFRRAIALNPDHPGIHSNLLLAMNYHMGLDAQTIFDEHVCWAQRHAARLYPPAGATYGNDRSPDRPLRVGYVSPDLKQHPVGFYMEPIINAHRRDRIEPFCYSDVQIADALSQRLQQSCAGWRSITGWSDDRVAQLIRDDRIDILIDLAGHTANHRLLVFARKPAPVQATYLGYVNTTGLATIDWAMSDKYLDPPGAHEAYRTETFMRFPRTYICYVPPMRCPDVAPSPAQRNGHVTFACMNNFSKVTPQTLDAWIAILARVPRSRLILQSDHARHLAQVQQRFSQAGIEKGRVEFAAKRPLDQYYALHNEFDIALDPFPHNGGTTTCDALWMGVPVVSLAGEHAVMRAGMSILSTIGLSELVADSLDRYIELAAELANDHARLAELRRTLRGRMSSSPLMDLPGYVNDLEQMYRAMWKNWCEKGG